MLAFASSFLNHKLFWKKEKERILLIGKNLKSNSSVTVKPHSSVEAGTWINLACSRNSAIKGINMFYYLFVHCNVQSLKHFMDVKTSQQRISVAFIAFLLKCPRRFLAKQLQAEVCGGGCEPTQKCFIVVEKIILSTCFTMLLEACLLLLTALCSFCLVKWYALQDFFK